MAFIIVTSLLEETSFACDRQETAICIHFGLKT